MPKVIVGMSGGVDSSVTAYLLKERGYDVEGVSFRLYEPESPEACASCCSSRAVEEAFKTAQHLGIPHMTIDARKDFVDRVIGPFVDAYLKGATPNPCILCNRHIKFPYLMREAASRTADFISTGHYARVEKTGRENMEMFSLKKGVDQRKDQSYALYVLNQEQLSRLILPLGNLAKDAVKKIAGNLKLPSAGKDESQEICFVEDRRYRRFIEERIPGAAVPGPIVDAEGRVIGTHSGICSYTIGQRKGMGISSPEPLYVIRIDAQHNTVYAGPREAAVKSEFHVGDLNWPDRSFADRAGRTAAQFRATVKVRSTMKDQPATIYLSSLPSSPGVRSSYINSVRVVFDEPQWAPAPGQSAVFFDQDVVIGGGIIL